MAVLFFGTSFGLNSLEALVEVVWKDIHLGKNGDFRIGVKFVDISPKDLNKLKSFLNNLINSKSFPERSLTKINHP